MSQQPQPQPTPQVPDQRFNEIQSQVREMREQNAALRNQIDMLTKMNRPNAQPEQKQIFQPDVDAALNQKFQAALQPLQQQFQQQLGFAYDQLDQVKFESKYRGSHLSDLMPEVERIQHENKLQNKWAPREEILKFAYFEKTGKKAAEPVQTIQAQPAATYDPYLGQWKGPDGNLVAPPAQAVQPPGLPPQSVETVQQVAPVPPQSPANQYVPNQTPALPPSTPPPQSVAAVSQSQAMGLDLKADDKTLESWASKYGDVPL